MVDVKCPLPVSSHTTCPMCHYHKTADCTISKYIIETQTPNPAHTCSPFHILLKPLPTRRPKYRWIRIRTRLCMFATWEQPDNSTTYRYRTVWNNSNCSNNLVYSPEWCELFKHNYFHRWMTSCWWQGDCILRPTQGGGIPPKGAVHYLTQKYLDCYLKQ